MAQGLNNEYDHYLFSSYSSKKEQWILTIGSVESICLGPLVTVSHFDGCVLIFNSLEVEHTLAAW